MLFPYIVKGFRVCRMTSHVLCRLVFIGTQHWPGHPGMHACCEIYLTNIWGACTHASLGGKSRGQHGEEGRKGLTVLFSAMKKQVYSEVMWVIQGHMRTYHTLNPVQWSELQSTSLGVWEMELTFYHSLWISSSCHPELMSHWTWDLLSTPPIWGRRQMLRHLESSLEGHWPCQVSRRNYLKLQAQLSQMTQD